MDHRKIFSTSKLIFSFSMVSIVIPVLAQQTRAQHSWLDRPLGNWNRKSGRPPQLPRPPAASGKPADTDRCIQQVRQLELTSPAEKPLVRRGWMLYGPNHSYELTSTSTALSGFDGMCRPLGFQAFVYWEGRYAGTLSPVPMDSRTDGSLIDIRLNSATSISADFARYKQSDALCCPSRISTVIYSLRGQERPTLTPSKVIHRTTPSEPPSFYSANQAVVLFGKRWTLTEMEDRKFDRKQPYIEFDRDHRRVSGSGGCNRFFGTFEIDGSKLKLSRIGSTKRACIDADLQRTETSFLQVLETTTRFEITGNKLSLYANDRLVLAFVDN